MGRTRSWPISGQQIRASPVLHVDETGWRKTDTTATSGPSAPRRSAAFVRGSRERAVLEREIGTDYGGVLVSDFYAAYTGYDGRHQYCWAHLLRDVDDLVGAAPGGCRRAWLGRWRARPLSARHRGHRGRPARPPGSGRPRSGAGALCAPYLGVAAAPQRVLCAAHHQAPARAVRLRRRPRGARHQQSPPSAACAIWSRCARSAAAPAPRPAPTPG